MFRVRLWRLLDSSVLVHVNPHETGRQRLSGLTETETMISREWEVPIGKPNGTN
jgi:hypothetical protein